MCLPCDLAEIEPLRGIIGYFAESRFRPFAWPIGLVTNLSFVRVADDSLEDCENAFCGPIVSRK